MATRKEELEARRVALEARLENARADEAPSIMDEIRSLLAEMGLPVDSPASATPASPPERK